MTTDDADTEICWRIDFATLQICQLTAFEAIRRGQMDVSEPRILCSRTRVKDINIFWWRARYFSSRLKFAMPDKSLWTGGGFPFWSFVLYLLELSGSVWKFMLSMALILCFLLFFALFNWLSQRCVGVSYALRVSPAVTRLTVYRRPQVLPAQRERPPTQPGTFIE